MTRKDFSEFMNKATGHKKEAKIKHLISACAKRGFMPNYKKTLRPIDAGFFLWIYAATPVITNDAAADWILSQMKRMMAGYEAGEVEQIPPIELMKLLQDRKKLKELQSIGIDQQTGAISSAWKDGSKKTLSKYSTIPANEIAVNKGVSEMTIYSGDFISMLAETSAKGTRAIKRL